MMAADVTSFIMKQNAQVSADPNKYILTKRNDQSPAPIAHQGTLGKDGRPHVIQIPELP